MRTKNQFFLNAIPSTSFPIQMYSHTHSFVHSVFNEEYSLNIHQVFSVSKMQEKTKRWHPPYSKVPLHFRGGNRKKGIKFRISEYLISNVKPQEMKIFARICFLLFFYGRKNTQKSQQAIPIMSYLTFSMKIVLITLRKMLHAFLFIQVFDISLHWKTSSTSTTAENISNWGYIVKISF